MLVALSLTAAVALYPPFRERVQKLAGHVREGEWNDVLTNRLGPWAAAVEMGLERPLLGWGPGTFQAEFVPHRLKAELRLRQRLPHPSNHEHVRRDSLRLPPSLRRTGTPSGRRARLRADPSHARTGAPGFGARSFCHSRGSFRGPARGTDMVPVAAAKRRSGSSAGGWPGMEAVVNRVSRVLIGVLMMVAVWPEPRRYLAERRLAAARSIVVSARAHPPDDPRPPGISRVGPPNSAGGD
jgi:hypothetical protein